MFHVLVSSTAAAQNLRFECPSDPRLENFIQPIMCERAWVSDFLQDPAVPNRNLNTKDGFKKQIYVNNKVEK